MRNVPEMKGTDDLDQLHVDPVVLEELLDLLGVLDGVCDIRPAMEKLDGALDLAHVGRCLGCPFYEEIDGSDAVLVELRLSPVLERVRDGSGSEAVRGKIISGNFRWTRRTYALMRLVCWPLKPS
jgi:hypothetical protein